MKIKQFSVDLDAFKTGICFYICNDETKIKNYVIKYYGKEFWEEHGVTANNYKGRTFWMRGYYPIIVLKQYARTPETIGILVHEIMHAVFAMLILKGIKLCDESEETFTYITEYFVSEALKKQK